MEMRIIHQLLEARAFVYQGWRWWARVDHGRGDRGCSYGIDGGGEKDGGGGAGEY